MSSPPAEMQSPPYWKLSGDGSCYMEFESMYTDV